MTNHPTIDLRHLDAQRREPEFLPADPMAVQQAREVITRMRLERMAEGFRRSREEQGKPA
ncbi:MAG: hypothetical protein ACTHMK_13810 [Dyella sp.]|uniref:hypothetical protein n=1 Tax=Dyella sp. TaxID=1869338 RepID=UPI003F812E12